MSPSQSASPTKRPICQTRPRSTYSYPWCPNQNPWLSPSFWWMERNSPASEPPTTSSSAPNRTFTPSRWKRGSRPPTAGARKSPAARNAVAIQNTAVWMCQVRLRA